MPAGAERRTDAIEGVLVKDDFISPAHVLALRACAETRAARGEFRAASIGARREQRTDVRGDSTCWLTAPLQPPEQRLLTLLERVRLEWNECAFLGLFELEAHYARYPAGSGYARHLDQVRGGAARLLSMVLYLNEAWPPEAGGELRLHLPDGSPRDIAPLGGRLVCFVTAGLEHEVLPATRERWSVTGWYRGRQ